MLQHALASNFKLEEDEMPADYAEVLRDLDATIASLEAEITTLRAGRPTIVMLRNKYSALNQTANASPSGGLYAHLGPTGAIPLALKGEIFALTSSQIADKLRAGGVRTKGQDFIGNVSATLSRLRDNGVVEKIGDGWKLRQPEDEQDGPDGDQEYESMKDQEWEERMRLNSSSIA